MADKGTKYYARLWGVSQSTIQKWCREGKIAGATQDKKGSPWHIPDNTVCPNKSKVKNANKLIE